MQSKIYGSSIGGDRLGTLQSATERTRHRVSQTLSVTRRFPYHHLLGFPDFLIFSNFCAMAISDPNSSPYRPCRNPNPFNPASRSALLLMCGIPWAHEGCDWNVVLISY